ncbi:MAG: ABC transporter permease [Bryobacteraceae bacterium]
MSLRARFRALFEGLFRRDRMESNMEEELRFHRERYAADLVRTGTAPRDAEVQAHREFGAIEPLKEECRQARGLRLLDETAQDLRYALRSFRKSPGFTAAAILTLAIGIGANTAIFTLVDRWILRPLPYPDPDRLTVIYTLDTKTGETASTSSADLLDWRHNPGSFEMICGWNHVSLTVTGGPEAEAVSGVSASAEFLPMLGVQPQLGRSLTAQDEAPGAPRVAVIAAGLWRRRFGANPDAIGKTLLLGGAPVTVVGVLADDFHLPLVGNVELWMAPHWTEAQQADRRERHWNVLARVRPGVSLQQARESLRAVSASIAAANLDTNRYRGIELRTLREEVGRAAGSEPLLGVFGLVGCVLLIACFNVANLQLGRSISRQKEIAVRLGIGAGRGRLMRQLITENFALFLAGAIASVIVAVGLTRWLAGAIPPIVRQYLPYRADLTVDSRALVYTLLVGSVTGLIFGLAPALECRGFDINRSLKEGAARLSGGRIRNGLIVVEIALAMLVLVSAGLLVKGLVRMYAGALGFDPRGVTTATVFTSNYGSAKSRVAFFDDVVRRLAATPGIDSAAAATQLPFFDGGDSFRYRILGAPAAATRIADFSVIAPAYFRTLRIPLLRGRTFSDADRPGEPLVAVINQTMANLEWPGRDPVGERFALGPDFKRVFTVAGVAGDTRGQNNLDKATPQIYASQWQFQSPAMTILARTQSPDRYAADEIRRAVNAADPSEAVAVTMTMSQAMTAQRSQFTVAGQLTACFAAIALLLAAIGIYGVTAYGVNARRREFGIRIALGAARRDVIAMVLRRGFALAIAGLAIGLVAALAVTRFLASLLYHVKPDDAATFISTGVMLAAVALFACYLPARRAADADPARVLRDE